MSMTKDEIIQEYQGAIVANGLAAAAGNEDAMKSYELFKAGLDALRPITREQVEKVWRGYWIKHDGYTECSKCEYWYPSTEDEEEDDRNPFCPACGAPMTDEAVDMVVERLEELKRGNSVKG